MEVNELAPLDWVETIDGTRCRVWCVDWQYRIVRCHKNGQEWNEDVEDLKAIPITDEVLTMFGFETTVWYNKYVYRDKEHGLDIWLTYDSDEDWLEFDIFEAYSHIKNVNELQHLLRLLNLDYVANNTKID